MRLLDYGVFWIVATNRGGEIREHHPLNQQVLVFRALDLASVSYTEAAARHRGTYIQLRGIRRELPVPGEVFDNPGASPDWETLLVHQPMDLFDPTEVPADPELLDGWLEETLPHLDDLLEWVRYHQDPPGRAFPEVGGPDPPHILLPENMKPGRLLVDILTRVIWLCENSPDNEDRRRLDPYLRELRGRYIAHPLAYDPTWQEALEILKAIPILTRQLGFTVLDQHHLDTNWLNTWRGRV